MNRFPDTAGHWAAGYINLIARLGWVAGYPNGTFAPDAHITRAEAAAIVSRALDRTPTRSDLLPGMPQWSDNMDVNAWYYLYIQDATTSRNHEINANGTETWVEIIPARDWSLLERPNSTPEIYNETN